MYPLILISTTVAVLAIIFKRSIRRAFLCCYDWITSARRVFDNWELGTYSSTSNLSVGSDATIGLEVREVRPSERASSPPSSPSPPSTPTTPDAQLSLQILSTVDEERSSQVSTDNSQLAVELAAESIAKICVSTLSPDKKKSKLDRRKSESSDSSFGSKKSPSPSKSRKQKKKGDHVRVDIEEEQTSFTIVKEKKSPKSKSPEKLAANISGSPGKYSPKASQPKKTPPKAPSPDIQPYKPKYTDKPSRPVESNISYAQVASSSTLAKEEITADKEAALLELKEPEPPRSSSNQTRQDSSESNSDAPIVFQTTSVVHRADLTESENSDENNVPSGPRSEINNEESRHSPEEDEKLKGEGNKVVAAKETQNLDDLSPIDSSERDYSRDESPSGDDEHSESIEQPRPPPLMGIPVVEVQEPLTETETLYSGEGSSRVVPPIASPNETQQSIPSIDSSTHQTFPLEIEQILNEVHHTRGIYKLVEEKKKTSTIADVGSDILDKEESIYSGDIDSGSNSRSEDISSRSDIAGAAVPVEVVTIEVQPCSSQATSSSYSDDNPAFLGYKTKDFSEDSLDNAARLRKISCSTEEPKSSETKESPVEEPSEKTSEHLSEESSDNKPKKKSKKRRKGKGEGDNSENPEEKSSESEEENQDISISEEIQEEPNFVQEEPEVENQDINKPEFLEEIPVEDFSDPPEPTMEMLEQTEQVRVLTLNDKEFQESTLYRLEKNWTIEFRLGPTLFGRKINIYCNFPAEENGKLKEFDRTRYQNLKWQQDGGTDNSDDTSLYARVVCSLSGSFHFYFKDNNTKDQSNCGSGYFLVDPVIKYGVNELLPLDCIQCQTVITKQLGSFSSWESKLKVSRETGYNMVHFTPIQELGASNSAYCINDQLKINPDFVKETGEVPTWEELRRLTEKMKKDWKVVSICDIVLNHTANKSPWILEHTEATYNCLNCKYMRPAYLLDAAFSVFQEDVKRGMYETRGIPPVIDSEDHINAMRYHLEQTVLNDLKLHELFVCDVNDYVSKFMEMARQHQPDKEVEENVQLTLIQDPDYRRLASSVDMALAMKIYNIYRPGCFDEDARLRRSCEEFKKKLDSLNKTIIDRIQGHLRKAIESIISGVRYWRVSSGGPKLKEITVQNPLIERYFTDYGEPKSIEEYEGIVYSDNSRFLMAHNGWIMEGYDCLVNFAGPESDVYLRRELIPWGDNVKLRYGEKPTDSPFLWDMMRKYVELTASIFDGVRLDNCHSTPLKVAEYLMDCARRVRPDIYVVAELFTGSVERDNTFVNRLGITSLIREAMSAGVSYELGGFIHRYGGVPVGSFYQPNVRPLVSSIAHALLFDLTHDNESPVKVKSVFNILPNAALVNMACCGAGSNRGYDELVPHQISVVDETREYSEWSMENVDNIPKYTSINCGIIKAKKALNDLHFKLGFDGFDQVYVHQMTDDVVAVTRHCPKTHQSYILVAFTAFTHPHGDFPRSINPLEIGGEVDEIVLEATLSHVESSNGGSKYAYPEIFERDNRYINGYSEYVLNMKQNIQFEESEIFGGMSSANSNTINLHFKNFKPGSIVIIKTSLPKAASEAVSELRKLSDQFSCTQETDLKRIIKKLKLRDLNRVLYRCDQEEREEVGSDVYKLSDGGLVYAGLQGFISLLSKIKLSTNALGHSMCENIRRGDWMIDYIYKRLILDEDTAELGTWIENNTKCLRGLPEYLKPAYFDLVFTGIYDLLIEHSYNSMFSFVNDGSKFVKALSMGSIQFAGYVKSADLPKLSPNLTPPKPPTKIDENGREIEACVSLSAGLPHFSVGYMRNWGRDTFISLRGLLLLTGRHQEARYNILAYAACLRHGLIPNLLDGGRKPRYNCRDAVWWWLYCIKCYFEEARDGAKILQDKVSRIFPNDDSQPQQPGAMDQSLQEVMQEALTRHFQGVTFRERNAGRDIDSQMTDNGFNNQIGVNPQTGFVFGGNVDNCGTWMDKMGSSEKAGNKGKPATPRDGSACEIVGLSKCVVSWLAVMHDKGLYDYSGVERTHPDGKKTNWSFESWSNKIKENFEKYFWIKEEPSQREVESDLINRRGIYKDCHGATLKYTDYQLRCNFPIVMVVAPELFNPQHAWTALHEVEKILLGPLGMKTLDPGDWAYRGDYDNSNDSEDHTVAQGFNYHQGPEWLWPIGFFLRAKLYFAAKNGKLEETIAETKCRLSRHFTELQTSDWRGLPELTNSNGSKCEYSSATQAWSMSCVLEVLYDLQRIESSI